MRPGCLGAPQGRLWIATDGNSPAKTGRADGLWAIETEGAARATSKLFFRCPNGGELCRSYFTPDDETPFVAIQHPGEADDDEPRPDDDPKDLPPQQRDGRVFQAHHPLAGVGENSRLTAP
mgnify:CR=1 FL=1